MHEGELILTTNHPGDIMGWVRRVPWVGWRRRSTNQEGGAPKIEFAQRCSFATIATRADGCYGLRERNFVNGFLLVLMTIP